MKLGGNAVAVRVAVHLLPYTKHNGISQLELSNDGKRTGSSSCTRSTPRRCWGRPVYRTGDRALAEEVLADTFERVLRSRKAFNPRKASAKTWIYSIALNRLRNVMRKRDAEARAMQRHDAGAPEAALDTDRVEEQGTVAAALAHLDEDEREAVALRYGSDLSVAEVAKTLGVKVSTAEGRIYRGLKQLRELLEEPSPRR